jgi:hypothetical protein
VCVYIFFYIVNVDSPSVSLTLQFFSPCIQSEQIQSFVYSYYTTSVIRQFTVPLFKMSRSFVLIHDPTCLYIVETA